jgi:protein SCO1
MISPLFSTGERQINAAHRNHSRKGSAGMTRFWAGTALLTVAAFLGGSAYYSFSAGSGDVFAECRGGQVGGGTIGGPFTLVDQTGRTVTDAEVFAKPALVYFGYTFCPDVCPLDNARNAEAADILEERGLDVTPVFITIDPARDTPEVMSETTANLHPKMIGLTGTQAQVDAATRAYKVVARKRDGDDPEFYLMDHTTMTYLMLPGAGFVDFFRREVTAEDMANRTACFMAAR